MLSSALVFAMGSLVAQTTLPTSWDFNGIATPPTGWSYDLGTSGSQIYTSGVYVNTSPALRMDGTGEYLQVFFASDPGNFVYYIAGTGTGTWQGTVLVQESVNGTAFTTVRTYNNGDVPSSTRLDSVTLNRASRYVRVTLSSKTSGFNLAIDDATVRKAPPSNSAGIEVSYANTVQINGNTLQTGNVTIIPVSIKNTGLTSKLYITNVAISGVDAANFTPSFINDSIDAGTSKTLNIAFAPSGADGDKKCQISIANNDAVDNNFILNIYAIKGSLASEPSMVGASAAASNKKTYQMLYTITNPTPPQGYIILRTIGAPSLLPQDGVTYAKGGSLGNSKIINVGVDNELLIKELVANTNYTFTAYAYNGYGAFLNYSNTAIGLLENTGPGAIGNYYTGISSTDNTLITKLFTKINPHFQVFYSNYASSIINNFYERDTTNSKKVITCSYSGYNYIYNPPFVFDTISREHVYPYSWMSETDQGLPNYSDLHNLHPTHQDKANAVRSNYPLANVKTVSFQFLDGKFGQDSTGAFAYEPRDEQKGACVRSMMYMLSCYNTVNSKPWLLHNTQSEALLKQWHQNFPPTNFEIARNDYIFNIQQNRNPFIDSPQLACYINFKTMTYNANGANCGITAGGNVAIDQLKPKGIFEISPVPANTELKVQFENNNSVELTIYDVYGRIVMLVNKSDKESTLDISNLANGAYLIIAKGTNLLSAKSFIKE